MSLNFILCLDLGHIFSFLYHDHNSSNLYLIQFSLRLLGVGGTILQKYCSGQRTAGFLFSWEDSRRGDLAGTSERIYEARIVP